MVKYDCDGNKWSNGYTHRNIMKPILLDALEELFPDKMWIVHHKDGDKSNNDLFNLEVMTQNDHVRKHVKRGHSKNEFPHAYYNKRINPENRPWESRLRYNKKTKTLGYYEDPYTASIVAKIVLEEL